MLFSAAMKSSRHCARRWSCCACFRASSDAPAARAGIAAGDVIIKIGTHEVTNVHDFMYALGELEPAREVAVEIDRDGKRIVLKVIPAPGR